MGRPRKVKPIKIERPDDMQPVQINGVIRDPFLPREHKLAILRDLILDPNTTPLEKRSCIESHGVLSGDTKETNTFVLRIEVIDKDVIKSTVESRITKPLIPTETK